MIKDSLLKSCLLDLNICEHLFSKFDASQADWKPRENMRSTLELMQYLTFIGGTMANHFVHTSEDREAARAQYRENSKTSKAMTFDQFPEFIEREKEQLHALYDNITDADLTRMTYHPFSNEESTLFEALLTVTKYLTAYRHQFFLYAKMCGAQISTPNNWYGMDPKPAPVKQAVAA
jgi:hypothetical protein